MFGQAKASFLVSNPREQRICTIGEVFRVLKSRIFRAKSGPDHERVTEILDRFIEKTNMLTEHTSRSNVFYCNCDHATTQRQFAEFLAEKKG